MDSWDEYEIKDLQPFQSRVVEVASKAVITMSKLVNTLQGPPDENNIELHLANQVLYLESYLSRMNAPEELTECCRVQQSMLFARIRYVQSKDAFESALAELLNTGNEQTG